MLPVLLMLAAGIHDGDASGRLVFLREVEVESRLVTLGDIVDLSPVPSDLAARVRGTEILRLPADRHRLSVPVGRLSERTRAIAPALSAFLPSAPDGLVTISLRSARPMPARSPRQTPCAVVLAPIAAGEAPRAETLSSPAPCDAAAPPVAFGYDRQAGVVRARRALLVGDAVAAPPAEALAGVRKGDRLTLRAGVGPVVVERDVEAVQPARPGEPVFVRGSGGAVFTAPAPKGAQ